MNVTTSYIAHRQSVSHTTNTPHTISIRTQIKFLSTGALTTTSKMHQALQMNEILRMIFDFFLVDTNYLNDSNTEREQKEMAKTLAALAVVCRAFCDPSLDVLWRYLPGLSPILSILPTKVLPSNLVRPCSASEPHMHQT